MRWLVYLPAADRRKVALPPPRSDVTRVDNITVLGVTFNSMLSFSTHVQKVASKAAASLYALRMLKAHGLIIGGGFNGRPLVQWPTRPLVGWALEAPPRPRGPGRLNFCLQLQSPVLNLWFIETWNEYADSAFCSFRILIKKLVTFWLTIICL